ncbi:MAG: glycosyltransferase family 1 protein [Chitinispirillaceae bacterium]|nr:glycosyltransferase family 1 protein [Chitinispirillaceae bacterium]
MTGQRWILVIPPEGAARNVAHHTANAFLKLLGQDTFKVVDSASYLHAFTQLLRTPDDSMTVDLFNQSLTVTTFNFQPTHLLVTALAPVTLFTLNLMRKYGIRTIHWFFEDYRKATYWESVIEGYDHFFAVQRGNLQERCAGTDTAYCFLPTACACADIPYTNGKRPYDLVFIGLASSYRASVLETLARGNLRIAIAGSGWNQYHGPLEPMIVTSSWVNDEQAFSLMQQSKTGINLSFDNPSGREDVQISPRLYDLMAAGCLPVSEDVPLLEMAAPGAQVSRFSTADEAVVVVKKLLEGYSPQDHRIVENRALVLNRHRYVHRIEEIIRETG